jgi:hypothetical protein
LSICIHVVAIASINRLKIKTYLSSKNIIFSDKAKSAPYSRKNPKEIINLVLQKKQKNESIDIASAGVKKKSIILPSKETIKKIINNIETLQSDSKNEPFYFHVPVNKEIVKLVENEISISKIDFETSNSSVLLYDILPSLKNNDKKGFNFADKNLQNEIFSSLIEDSKESFKIDPNYLFEKNASSLNTLSDFENLKIKLFLNNISSKKEAIQFLTCMPNEQKQDLNIKINEPVISVNINHKFHKVEEDSKKLFNKFSDLEKNYVKLFQNNFPLIQLPTLNDLTTLSYKDYFDLEVSFAPQRNQKGYIFAITLIPKNTIKLTKLKQNFFFLIDKANSIQSERLTATRHALVSTLSMLDENDTFNILTFDNKLEVLSPFNLPADSLSLSRAKGFLRNQKIGSFFSSANFSMPLFKILNNNTKKDEVNIAILLTNGEGLNKQKNSRVFTDWTKLNKGNLSLYTLCLSDDPNTSRLEMFSFLNKGKLISSGSQKGIKRKLQKLLESINHPIAKNITANAICLDDSANIKLYNSKTQAPNLYLEEPYVIFGTIEKLQDFTIFVQGDCKNNFFNLKKNISFDNAKQADEVLQKELAIKQATSCYEEYITDNNSNHLQKAKKYLEPFEIKPIF